MSGFPVRDGRRFKGTLPISISETPLPGFTRSAPTTPQVAGAHRRI